VHRSNLAALVAGCRGDDNRGSTLTGRAAEGEQLVEAHGCLSCHSTDGTRGTGLTWQGLAGSDVVLSDGRTVLADADYLRRSILDPDAATVDGFPAGLMRTSVRSGSLTDAEVDAIVAYLETSGTARTARATSPT
jgi:cytochrome c oxidase subunit 2